MTAALIVQNILDVLDDFAPFSLAAEWDNVGLLLGRPEAPISGICVALDPSLDLLDEALEQGLNTIITHHPLLFHPLKQIRTDSPLGQIIAKAMAAEMQIIACHTNLDVVPDGVSDVLAHKLGLVDCQPLQVHGADSAYGFGRLGRLPSAMVGAEFLDRVSQTLQQPEMIVAGSVPEIVHQVAVCGGSCGDLAELARQQGAQIFITAEVKHSVARWAEDAGICLLDCGHFSTEQIIIEPLVARLDSLFGAQVKVQASIRQKKPLQGRIDTNKK